MLVSFRTIIGRDEDVEVSCQGDRIILIEKKGDPSDVLEFVETNFRAWVDHDEYFLSEKDFKSLKKVLNNG